MSGRPSSAFGHHHPGGTNVSSTPSLIPRRTSLGGSGIPTLSRSSGASGAAAALGVLGQSGLPTPSSSSTSFSSNIQPPSTAASNRTLKRTSNQAGFPTPGPSAYKRSATPANGNSNVNSAGVPSTPSNKLTSLRHDLELTTSTTTLQKQLNNSQRENGQIMRELGSLQERVKQLEKERAILLSREEKITGKDTLREQEREAERRTLVASLGEFRQRYAVLEDENDLLQNESNRIKHENELMNEEKNNVLKQMEVLQDELQKLDEENHKLRKQEDELKEVKEKLADLQDRPSVSTLSSSSTGNGNGTGRESSPSITDVLRRELHHQVQHLRTLEQNNARLTKEIAILKQDKANVELLKEEKLSLESKVRRMDTLRRTLADVEGEVAILKRERDEWAVFLRSSQQDQHEDGNDESNRVTEKFETPAQLAKSLASAKIEIASLQEKLESNASNLKLRGEIMSTLESRIQELEQETIPFWKKESESFKRRFENLERIRKLDLKELGMLKEQIQSYAIEESQLMLSSSTSSRREGDDDDVKPNLAAYDNQKTLQINHLMELLDAQKQETARLVEELEKLAEQLKDYQSGSSNTALHGNSTNASDNTAKQENVRNAISEQISRNEELQETLRLTQMELAELQNEVESLDAQIDSLQFALGRGEYNIATTKVLSLKDNPADMDLAIRTETLERLKEENRILLEKLEEAEQAAKLHRDISVVPEALNGRPSGHSTAAVPTSAAADPADTDSVPKQTFLNLQAENEALQAKVEQGEKSRARLREVFQKTASQLRDACKSLLGYSIEPVENGRMKLTTVFGGSDYQLVFGPGPAPLPSSAQPSGDHKSSKSKLQLVGGNETFITSPRVQQGLHFWVAERGCLPGFLASMTLELFEESTRGRTVGYMEG